MWPQGCGPGLRSRSPGQVEVGVRPCGALCDREGLDFVLRATGIQRISALPES